MTPSAVGTRLTRMLAASKPRSGVVDFARMYGQSHGPPNFLNPRCRRTVQGELPMVVETRSSVFTACIGNQPLVGIHCLVGRLLRLCPLLTSSSKCCKLP